MFKIERDSDSSLVKMLVSGKLTHRDYEQCVPQIEAAIEESGPLRIVMELKDFQGWEPRAAWDELKFDIRHRADFRRMAIIGDKAWESWATTLSKPFFDAEMRFFPSKDAAKAEAWVGGD